MKTLIRGIILFDNDVAHIQKVYEIKTVGYEFDEPTGGDYILLPDYTGKIVWDIIPKPAEAKHLKMYNIDFQRLNLAKQGLEKIWNNPSVGNTKDEQVTYDYFSKLLSVIQENAVEQKYAPESEVFGFEYEIKFYATEPPDGKDVTMPLSRTIDISVLKCSHEFGFAIVNKSTGEIVSKHTSFLSAEEALLNLNKTIRKVGTVLFYDVTVGEDSTWSQMCDSCWKKHHESLAGRAVVEIGSGHGICGIEGCNNEADHYIDFLNRGKLCNMK
jgi:hypothetical protein